MREYIGIDIGGTTMVAARFSDSEILDRSEVATGASRSGRRNHGITFWRH